MKLLLFTILLLSSHWAFAEEAKKDEWENTRISDEDIHKIQLAQFKYKKCAADQINKPENNKLDSRNATDFIIRQCEPVLAEVRKDYTDAQVPGVIADRQLKKLRIQITRNVLQEMMYREAAKKSGQP